MFFLTRQYDADGSATFKRLAIAFGLSSAAALLAGVILGVIAGPTGLGFGPLVLLVGLSAGLSARLMPFANPVASWSVVVAATVFGLATHGLVVSATTSHWSAGEEVSREELDFTVQKYLTGQLCRQRRVVAFGYDEVPQDIKDEAARRLAGMSTDEKNTLINETFGRRINENDSMGAGFWSQVSSGIAGLGAVVLAIGAMTLQWRRQ